MIESSNVVYEEVPEFDEEYKAEVGLILESIDKNKHSNKVKIEYYAKNKENTITIFKSEEITIKAIKKDEGIIITDKGEKISISDIVQIK